MQQVMDVLGTVWGWLTTNYGLLAFVAAVIVAVIYDREAAKRVLYSLFLAAEKMAADLALETGPEKMDWVLDQVDNVLPPHVLSVLRVLAALQGKTYEEVRRSLAQKWYDAAKTWEIDHVVEEKEGGA